MKYNGIVISDIHFGVIESEILYRELHDVFLNYLYHMEKLDFIVITGDYFDHKLYVSDRTSDYALLFMDRLVEIAKKNQCPIRIVYGTESHEVNQYNIFSIYETSTEVDFKIIHTVTEEELLQDLHVLYIPEEYILDKKEYYNEFFSKKNNYDYVFGHGVIQEVMTHATRNHPTDKNGRKKVPVFSSIELSDICKGQVYFGHYHINTTIDDKIFYVGSYSRFIHDEEKAKGFYHIICNTEKNTYKEIFIENTLAKTYVTFTYGYKSTENKTKENIVEELDKLDKVISAKNYDYVRYIFNIPEDSQNPEFVINVLNERYKFKDHIKVKIQNGYVVKKKEKRKEQLDSIMKEYAMIFDKSICIEDKIEYFIKKTQNKDIPIENIKRYLEG